MVSDLLCDNLITYTINHFQPNSWTIYIYMINNIHIDKHVNRLYA
jgi:hypothetical protein